MPDAFDPYRTWLGVTAEERPLGHYALLDLPVLETDLVRVEQAVARQTAKVIEHQSGAQAELAEAVLDQLERAKRCLLNPISKAFYDAQLRDAQRPPPAAPAIATTVTPGHGIPAAVVDSGSMPIVLVEAEREPEPQEAPLAPVNVPASEAPNPKPRPNSSPPTESADAIAARVLREDVKPAHVPQRAAADARPKPAVRSQPATPPSRFESRQPAPSAQGTSTASPKAPRVQATPPPMSKVPSKPLLSQSDVAVATRRQSRPPDPVSRWKLPNPDVLELLNEFGQALARHPKRCAAAVLISLAAWGTYYFATQKAIVSASRRQLEYAPPTSEERREAAQQLRVLYDPGQDASARLAAVEALRTLGPAVIHEFASSLEALAAREPEEATRQALRAALEITQAGP